MGLERVSQFTRDLERISEDSIDRAETLLRALCIAVSVPVIRGTPVDTGRARGGWVPSIGAPSGDVGAPNKSGQNAVNRATSVGGKVDLGDRYVLTNNVEYVPILEAGLRVQDGRIVGSEQAEFGWIQGSVDTVVGDFEKKFSEESRRVVR